MEDISAWLGYPASRGYKEREAKYLELENRYQEASMKTGGKNFVFDTTGASCSCSRKHFRCLKIVLSCI